MSLLEGNAISFEMAGQQHRLEQVPGAFYRWVNESMMRPYWGMMEALFPAGWVGTLRFRKNHRTSDILFRQAEAGRSLLAKSGSIPSLAGISRPIFLWKMIPTKSWAPEKKPFYIKLMGWASQILMMTYPWESRHLPRIGLKVPIPEEIPSLGDTWILRVWNNPGI